MTEEQIIKNLPYQDPFLFVDQILEVDENHIKGTYTLKHDEYFYKGHFKEKPITPGVILTEIMAQIGLVCLGIFILDEQINENPIKVAMSSTAIDFYKPVLPGDKVIVKSKKEYFRFNKLKCKVEMFNGEGNLVAKGLIAGMTG
ncbi:3-hydroxyacyl-[acyl-carrier-protein] dehydratase [Aquimarina amphilecti]|uniref:3-hydroxyacyl-[acyl-carrier-protein] dehydratase n=1 Tax=Aquimarina amphilecti TaxID=1038014 RepID=A0A1H7H230_AQUAM|nr:3-hydroxyacyl-ACP dehydratase FabZ family protein [Aquimarina amphilecti]SEK44476.1 3-hydroxyacyl-[acyl-carrier-protein] dehydratase [Aquimarina amphilecti]